MRNRKTINPTAVRSQRILKESFVLLLRTKPLSEISIGEICRCAQLTRPTFYNHFCSKEDIAAGVIDDAFDEFEQIAAATGIQSTEALLKAFLGFWGDHRELLIVIADNGLLPLVSERFEPYLQRIYAASPFTDKSRTSEELAFHDAFLAAGMAGLLGMWASVPRGVSAQAVAEYMENMLNTLAAGMERDRV